MGPQQINHFPAPCSHQRAEGAKQHQGKKKKKQPTEQIELRPRLEETII